MQRRALVFGGSGAVGGEVVRALAAAGVPTTFTFHQNHARAQALASDTGQTALPIDLREREAVRDLVRRCAESAAPPNVFIHCAAVSRDAPLGDIGDTLWRDTLAVNAESAFLAVQGLAPALARQGGGSVVVVGALDRTQSFGLPVHVAASQGMLSAMTMALAKALGPSNVCVNMVVLGPLENGLQRMTAKLIEDYKSFSALRRIGTPAEAARSIVWLALENTYMSGKVLTLNGGV